MLHAIPHQEGSGSKEDSTFTTPSSAGCQVPGRGGRVTGDVCVNPTVYFLAYRYLKYLLKVCLITNKNMFFIYSVLFVISLCLTKILALSVQSVIQSSKPLYLMRHANISSHCRGLNVSDN